MPTPVRFEDFAFEGQQSTKALGFEWDAPFPLALKAVSTKNAGLSDYIEAIKQLSSSGKLPKLVRKHGGAVLIRGIPINNPQDYSDVAHAFGFRAHEEVGRPPMRTVLAKNVKTANEGRDASVLSSCQKLIKLTIGRRSFQFGHTMSMAGQLSTLPG